MKIIRLSTFLNFGGIETKMANLSYVQDGNEWIFVCFDRSGVAADKIRENGKKVICLNTPYKIPSVVALIKLIFLLWKERPDVLHCSGAEANFHGFISAKLMRVKKIIVEEIGIPAHSSIAFKIFRYIFSKSDFVVGESEAVIENILSQYGIKPSKTEIVSNFIPIKKDFLLTRRKNEANVFTLISVARLEPVKNIEGIFRAIYNLKKENIKVKYLLLGDGSLMGDLKQLVLELDIKENVQFLGFKKDPRDYFKLADLFVLNSNAEGFSNALLEAMVAGLPCITTRVGAADEIINLGVNGWVVEPNNDSELFKKIKEVISLNLEERKEIGLEGRSTIAENYSLEQHIAKLMTIYQ